MRFLFPTFEGGGHVPPVLLVARRLQARGHEVLVLSDEANRSQAMAKGLPFESWRRAPNRQAAGLADDPLDEWRSRWPPSIVKRLCKAVITGPSAAYAEDTLETCAGFRPDLVVSNELLFGVMAAAEAQDIPLALLTANVWCFPTREDLPPFGPGFTPSSAPWAQRRDALVREISAGWYDAGLQDLNATRKGLGLAPLTRTLQQLETARLVLLGVASAFDFNADAPAPFAYAGPLAEAPDWALASGGDPAMSDVLPNVLVSFSTTAQGHEHLLRRAVAALSQMPVQTIVTLGPALRDVRLAPRPNLTVSEHASHDAIVPGCDLVVTHAGHGTVIRPLSHGVPVLCLPTGRDQPENAARVTAAGAGVRLGPGASPRRIRRSAERILGDPSYRLAARRLGDQIAMESDEGLAAARRLEALVQRKRIV